MRYSLHILFLLLVLQGRTEGDNFIQQSIADGFEQQQLFSKYVDTISEYLYKDITIALDADQQCQDLLSKGVNLPDSTYFSYLLQKIDLHHSNMKPILAFWEISNYENRLDELEISQASKKTFNYLYGYTLMELGQREAAQERFYIDLEKGIQDLDTSLQFFALYSLGQIYNQKGEFNIALDYNQRALQLLTKKDVNKSSLVSIQIELADTYANLKKWDESMQTLDLANQVASKNGFGILASDINIKKGHIYLKRRDLQKAIEMYNKVVFSKQISKDREINKQAEALHAQILTAKSEYRKAFDIYIQLLDDVAPNDLSTKKELTWKAQQLAQKRGDYKTAYHLFADYNDISNKIDSNSQALQSQYFKIKFDTEAKERENAELSAYLKSKDHESMQLYLWIALLTLFLLGLVAALYQRVRYSKRLKSKVEERTVEINESIQLRDKANAELTEFNRILSHDLKEPLRGMIGFSQLLMNELEDKNSKSQDYLDHIVRSSLQMNQLIDSVNHYQKAKICETKATEKLNIKDKISTVLVRVNGDHPDKEIDLITNADSQIRFCNDSFESIFHIIFDNAIRYNTKKVVRIDVNHNQTSEYHEFEISDNGEGIPMAHRDKVFAKFQRANSSLRSKGAGMGLSIASKLLESVGGSLSLEDKSKLSGSTFLIKIPVILS